MILPVLDLMHGQIVRGVAGRRDEYRPIVSKWTDSAEPRAVAEAIRTHFGFNEFYLADLDAIQEGTTALATYQELRAMGLVLWIDAGVSSTLSPGLAEILKIESFSAVVGLETVDGSAALAQILGTTDKRRIVFSLDLKSGQPLIRASTWNENDPWAIATQAIDMGVESLIILDLGRVGVGEGVGTEDLCARVKKAYPRVRLIAGGGVRGIDDVLRLQDIGVDYVLVASALHDGRIGRADLNRL